MRRVLSPDGVWLPAPAQRKAHPEVQRKPQRRSTGHTEGNAGFLASLAAIAADDTRPDLSAHGCRPMTEAEAECWQAWQNRRRQSMAWCGVNGWES